jgi:hypothetical protein
MAAIGIANKRARIVLIIACHIVNQTTLRVVCAVSIANDSKLSEIIKIFNAGATTNVSIATTGKTASHLLVDRYEVIISN